jgi:hypothetical protein
VLLPHFKDYRLSQITVAQVDGYRVAQVRETARLAAARARGEKIAHRPLSASTINRTIGPLAQSPTWRWSTDTFPPTRQRQAPQAQGRKAAPALPRLSVADYGAA